MKKLDIFENLVTDYVLFVKRLYPDIVWRSSDVES